MAVALTTAGPGPDGLIITKKGGPGRKAAGPVMAVRPGRSPTVRAMRAERRPLTTATAAAAAAGGQPAGPARRPGRPSGAGRPGRLTGAGPVSPAPAAAGPPRRPRARAGPGQRAADRRPARGRPCPGRSGLVMECSLLSFGRRVDAAEAVADPLAGPAQPGAHRAVGMPRTRRSPGCPGKPGRPAAARPLARPERPVPPPAPASRRGAHPMVIRSPRRSARRPVTAQLRASARSRPVCTASMSPGQVRWRCRGSHGPALSRSACTARAGQRTPEMNTSAVRRSSAILLPTRPARYWWIRVNQRRKTSSNRSGSARDCLITAASVSGGPAGSAVTVHPRILGSPLLLAFAGRAIPAPRAIASGGPLTWPVASALWVSFDCDLT